MINPSKVQELINAIEIIIKEVKKVPLPKTFRDRWLRELKEERDAQYLILQELKKGQDND